MRFRHAYPALVLCGLMLWSCVGNPRLAPPTQARPAVPRDADAPLQAFVGNPPTQSAPPAVVPPGSGIVVGFSGNPPITSLPPGAAAVSIFGMDNPYFPPIGVGTVAAFNVSPNLIAYSANMAGQGGLNFQIFVYNLDTKEVITPPGINTEPNAFDPQLSTNGRYLTYSIADAAGNVFVRFADLALGVIDTLPDLNIAPVQYAPAIDNTGTLLAYVARDGAGDTLRLFNLKTNKNFTLESIAAADLTTVANPTISGNGRVIAFSEAGTGVNQISAYDVVAKSFLRVPFAAQNVDVSQPALSFDGTQMLFVVNHGGQTDIECADLVTGFVDNLALLNSGANETAPKFLGTGSNWILFQSDRSGHDRMYVYHRDTGVIDTLAIPQLLGGDYMLIAPSPAPIVSPSPSPTASPSASPTASPTASPSASPTASPEASATASPASRTVTTSASPTASPASGTTSASSTAG